jgi:heptaprenyl diphosphate synthase
LTRTFTYLEEESSLMAPLQQVLQKIDDVVQKSPTLIRGDLETLTKRPGKLLRPAFFLLCAEGGDAEPSDLIAVAAAIELLHIASLAHDDVLDDALKRRGNTTLYRKEGAKRAILAGDYLLSQSLRLSSSHFSESLVPYMTESLEQLCLSEIDQDSSTGDFFINRDRYYKRISGKTAELFGLSCFTGALMGGRSPEVQNELYHMGLEFGMAFQIRDDIMDYTGDSRKMGKPAGNDLKDGIPTLPLILALEEEQPVLKFLLRQPFRSISTALIRSMILRGKYTDKAFLISEEYTSKSLSLSERALSPEAFKQYSNLLFSLQKTAQKRP